MNARRTKYFESVQEILKGMDPKIRAHCHYEQLLLDSLPLFMFILNPEFKAVRTYTFHLFNETIILSRLNFYSHDCNLYNYVGREKFEYIF